MDRALLERHSVKLYGSIYRLEIAAAVGALKSLEFSTNDVVSSAPDVPKEAVSDQLNQWADAALLERNGPRRSGKYRRTRLEYWPAAAVVLRELGGVNTQDRRRSAAARKSRPTKS